MIRWLLLFVCVGWGVSVAAQRNVTLSGTVKDASTGEDVAGAVVYEPKSGRGVTSNAYGFYSFTLPAGDYEIVFSLLGYETRREKIPLWQNRTLHVTLTQETNELDAVVVRSERPNANVVMPEMSVAQLSARDIKLIPALMGEVDVLKAIQLMPGVQSTSEGASGFNVRGGNYDQNLILLDEATIYNVSHLFGFFSIFNNDAIRDVKLYKGDIPAVHGGRLSSLLDIRTRDGNNQKFGGRGGIGLISSRLTLEGPIVRDKASFLVSGRRTYLEIFKPFVRRMRENDVKAFFYDLNGKVNWRIDERNRIFLSAYTGRDEYGMKSAAMGFSNNALTFRWNHIFGPRLFSNFSFVRTEYDYFVRSSFTEHLAQDLTSRLRDAGFKADFTWQANPANQMRFGYHLTHHLTEPGMLFGVGSSSIVRNVFLADKYGLEHSLYASNESRLGERFVLKLGLRGTGFHNIGNQRWNDYLENYQVVAQKYHRRGQIYYSQYALDPRVGMLYAFDDRHSVKFSYNRTTQFVQMASNSASGSPIDIWFQASQNVKPQKNDQFALGYYRNFKDDTFEFSFEVYYRNLKNAVDFKDHADLLLNENFEQELRFGKGYAYGFEAMLSKNGGRLNGWISYTFTRSMKRIDTVNEGRWYRASSDRPVHISLVVNYLLSPRWTISGNWVCASGMPVTYPTGRMWIENSYVPIYSGRNEYRFPTYHRLDLSATWNLSKPERRVRSDLNFSIYNAYGRKNPWMIYFKQEQDNPHVTYGEMIYLFTFVPSVTWNFTF